MISVDVRYLTGSSADKPRTAGLAHMVEHLSFEATPWGPEKPSIGAVLNELSFYANAWTTWEYTHYHTMVPPPC